MLYTDKHVIQIVIKYTCVAPFKLLTNITIET